MCDSSGGKRKSFVSHCCSAPLFRVLLLPDNRLEQTCCGRANCPLRWCSWELPEYKKLKCNSSPFLRVRWEDYRGAKHGVLTGNVTKCCGLCTTQYSRALQRVIKTTQNITGTNLHLKVLYVTFRNVLLLVTPVAVNWTAVSILLLALMLADSIYKLTLATVARCCWCCRGT